MFDVEQQNAGLLTALILSVHNHMTRCISVTIPDKTSVTLLPYLAQARVVYLVSSKLGKHVDYIIIVITLLYWRVRGTV